MTNKKIQNSDVRYEDVKMILHFGVTMKFMSTYIKFKMFKIIWCIFCCFDSLLQILKFENAKPLVKVKHMVKTVCNMSHKEQKVPFQPLTLDMVGYKHLAQTVYKPLDKSATSLTRSGYNLVPGLSGEDTQVIVNPKIKEVVL